MSHCQCGRQDFSKFIDETVDFLKLDIEGAELEVLEELAAFGKLNYVRQMVIEFHHHIKCGDDRMSHLLKLLEEHGFGYHVRAPFHRPIHLGSFQDIMVRAYKQTTSWNMTPKHR